jgi:hypothetical protein
LRLDGEILIERPHVSAVGLEQDLVVPRVGDGTTRGDGGKAGAFRGVQAVLHAVSVKQGISALGVKSDDAVEVVSSEVAVRPRAPEAVEELAFAPGPGHTGSDDLLRKDVERSARDRRAVEHPPVHRVEKRFRFG